METSSHISEFQPINDDHAIESVKFGITFTEQLRMPAIAALTSNHHLWHEAMPAVSDADTIFETNGRRVNAPGVMFAFVRPDATPVWSMKAVGNQLTVETNIYTRWETVWTRALSHLVEASRVIRDKMPDVEIFSVDLAVKDVFKVSQSAYDLSNIFKKNKYLSAQVFDAGRLWHLNSGWFDERHDNRVLHHLNCDTVEDSPNINLNITHFQSNQFQRNSHIKLMEDSVDRVRLLMDDLHRANKLMLENLLKEPMLKRIGMLEGLAK